MAPPAAAAPVASQTTRVSAEDFAKANPGALTVKVVVPQDSKRAQWNFSGQVLEIVLPGVMETVAALKAKIKEQLGGMPPQKMILRVSNGGAFLKDAQTFAKNNLGSGTVIDLGVKERGRRRR